MANWEFILLEKPAEHIARVVLNRPQARNAQNTQFLYELNEAYEEATQAEDIKVIITAAKSGHELNFARYGQYLAEAIADPRADLDKDGQVSLLEAFLTASSRTEPGVKAPSSRVAWRNSPPLGAGVRDVRRGSVPGLAAIRCLRRRLPGRDVERPAADPVPEGRGDRQALRAVRRRKRPHGRHVQHQRREHQGLLHPAVPQP